MHKNANCRSDNCEVLKEPVWGRGIQPEHQEEATQWQNYTDIQVHLNLTTSMILSSMHEVSLCTSTLDLLQFDHGDKHCRRLCIYTESLLNNSVATIFSSNKKLTGCFLEYIQTDWGNADHERIMTKTIPQSKWFCQSHFLLHFQILWINVAVSSTRA